MDSNLWSSDLSPNHRDHKLEKILQTKGMDRSFPSPSWKGGRSKVTTVTWSNKSGSNNPKSAESRSLERAAGSSWPIRLDKARACRTMTLEQPPRGEWCLFPVKPPYLPDLKQPTGREPLSLPRASPPSPFRPWFSSWSCPRCSSIYLCG